MPKKAKSKATTFSSVESPPDLKVNMCRHETFVVIYTIVEGRYTQCPYCELNTKYSEAQNLIKGLQDFGKD